MKFNRKFLFLVAIVTIILAACGNEKESGVTKFKWGMKQEEIIKLEAKNGNKSYEEESSNEGIKIDFMDVAVSGYEADVEYVFKDEVANHFVMANNQHGELPDTIELNDSVLVEVNHFYWGIDEKESQSIYDAIVAEYGEPEETDSDSYFWYGDETNVYFDGIDFVSYGATYTALEKYMN